MFLTWTPGSFSTLFRWHIINRNHAVRPTIHDRKHCTISCLVRTTASNYSTQASEQRTKEVCIFSKAMRSFIWHLSSHFVPWFSLMTYIITVISNLLLEYFYCISHNFFKEPTPFTFFTTYILYHLICWEYMKK